ncbi:hypothetical protein [Vibrio viridaestus]|uniref:Uncharacterized protein n=1 Tax=Vibrio viridaestus TaxID=2487322 RepID=A0A3N9TJ64_9VIBR|nr:hypothetical protein [Vibrio viridaestus]RQW63893.1 hypothetical protein EES38_04610 [Vibrio viridaestus]
MIDLKELLKDKITSLSDLSLTLLKSFDKVRFDNVSHMLEFTRHRLGDKYLVGRSNWLVTTIETPFSVNDNLYLKAIGDLYVEDFNDGRLTQTQYVTKANNYCHSPNTSNRLIFDSDITYKFDHTASFEIFVESGGWYSTGNCRLVWMQNPSQGFAIKILGRYSYTDKYYDRVNDSNYSPLEGFTIGEYGRQRLGTGLQIGSSTSIDSMSSARMTSKFVIQKVSVFDFDDVITMYPGSWAFELLHVHTMGGSWKTPKYFRGLDFGENIRLSHCFIADNHKRMVDRKLGQVHFRTGEFVINSGSFDNMKVVVDGDASVKMMSVHFENPSSTAKNKRFLEVVGDSAFCLLESPQIVIRNTPIYSTLFYCKSGSRQNRHPFSGGLSIVNPSYQSVKSYRPDLAPVKDSRVSYDSDGYLELVGGGGRVYYSGSAHINSLFFNHAPIPISRSLVGASLANYSFDKKLSSGMPKFWTLDDNSHQVNSDLCTVTTDDSWVGKSCLKTTVNQTNTHSSVFQDIDCSNGQLCLGTVKVKWKISSLEEGYIKGKIQVLVEFIDFNGSVIDGAGHSANWDVNNRNSITKYLDWEHAKLIATAPEGTKKVRIRLNTFLISKKKEHFITSYWDCAVFNVL